MASQSEYYCGLANLYDSHNCTDKRMESAVSLLMSICALQQDSKDVGERHSEPMVWIGIYVTIASSFCVLAMVADLFHGFRNKKFWFPCKYFSLNAASITVITIAVKLPLDLTSEMPSYVDQAAKVGSLPFMCTIMANLMPSLASMENRALLANVIGLSILVITIIVNICIQIATGIVFNDIMFSVTVSCIYMAMIFLLLMITISSSLTIPIFKEILEFKYQATEKTNLADQSLQHTQMSIVEKLRQDVKRYWVMAETGSPQFVIASNPLSTASGVICVFVLAINLLMLFEVLKKLNTSIPYKYLWYGSPYKRSTLAIVVTQSIGVIVGTIAPICRCFSGLSFKLNIKWNRNHFMYFKIDKHWTQKLYEWKQLPIPFLSVSHRSRTLIYISNNIILSHCIKLQSLIVVFCKLLSLIPKFVIYCVHCWKSMKARMFPSPIVSTTDDIDKELISNYILQIHDEMELAEGTLKGISKSMDSCILKAEKEQKTDLLELLQRSTDFKGVGNFDTVQVQSLLSVELVNTWSLPVVTLTCIAVALPNIPKDTIESLLTSVGEGISYTHLVEESLNCASEYVNIRKTTMSLWHEVKYKCKWLDNTLAKKAFTGKTATQILTWFADKSEEIVKEIKERISGDKVENTPRELIAANSMYRISRTILLRDQQLTKKRLFGLLNYMIADILCACFTNLPRVITMKCHESVIEKRETSVKAAAKLLGKTRKIIERLEKCENLPNMDPDKMAYVDEWHLYLEQSIP